MAFKPIEILINAKDDASKKIDGVKGKIVALGAAIASYVSVKAFVGMVSGAADLEQALSRVAAAADGGAEEMQALRNAAEEAGRTTTYTSLEAAGALENLVKAGLSASDAVGALPATLALAQAGDIELADSAEIVTKAMAGMGLAIEDAGRIADVFATGANATNTSVQGLAQAFSFVAPVAQSVGLTLEQTTAILGKMADAGIDASRSGTALSNILSQFQDPAGKFRQELAAIGITTNDFDQALHQLAEAGPRGTEAILAVGRAAGPALRALLNQGMGSLDELVGSLNNAEGAAAQTAATMQDNLHGAMSKLAAVWDSVKNTFATPVLPVLQRGVESLAGAFNRALESGVVQRFGQVIGDVFDGAANAAADFIGKFDFDAALERLQGFAAQSQETFARIGEYASTAGNAVSLAWNVMATGTNTVLAGIYKVGEGLLNLGAWTSEGVALINDGLAKVTFGGLSKRFADAADSIRANGEAAGAAAAKLGEKAQAALDNATTSAYKVHDAFGRLTTTAADTTDQVSQLTTALNDASTAAQTHAAQAEKAAGAQEQVADTAAAARARIEDLQRQYQEALELRDFQRAVELNQQLRDATREATAAQRELASTADDAAAAIAAAFQAAGVKTRQELQETAAAARKDFELIRQSGQATAQGVSEAWRRAADAAIAASDGIVPAWVKAEAAAHGYKVQVDETGQATIAAADAGAASVQNLASSWDSAADSARSYETAAKSANSEHVGRNRTEIGANRTEIGANRTEIGEGGSRSKKRVPEPNTWLSAYHFLKRAGLTDEEAAQLAGEFFTADNRPNTGRHSRWSYTGNELMSALLANAAAGTIRKRERAKRWEKWNEEHGWRPHDNAQTDGQDAQRSTGKSQGVSYINNITLGSQRFQVRTADPHSTQQLNDLLAELQRGRSVAS